MKPLTNLAVKDVDELTHGQGDDGHDDLEGDLIGSFVSLQCRLADGDIVPGSMMGLVVGRGCIFYINLAARVVEFVASLIFSW